MEMIENRMVNDLIWAKMKPVHTARCCMPDCEYELDLDNDTYYEILVGGTGHCDIVCEECGLEWLKQFKVNK